jgi:DNA (cytosine-5)-methyltransferase 1
MPLTQLELFAGIGGFGLAGHWAGIKTVCQIEIDPFCQKVLAKNFPNAKKHGDIKTFNGTEYRGTVDIISGGFPCQPYSSAGKRLGKEDERHLWPEMLRVIREVRPRWVVGENVFGLINWSEGLVFDEVQSDLESEGYEVQAFVLPAAAVNAPHRRDRVWFVAYAGNNGSITAEVRQSVGERNDRDKAGENEAEQFAGRSGKDAGAIANTTNSALHIRHEFAKIRRRKNEAEQVRMGCNVAANANEERRKGQQRKGKRAQEYEQPFTSEVKDATDAAQTNSEQPVSARTRRDGIAGGSVWNDANANEAGCKERHASAVASRSGFNTGHDPENWNEWTLEPPICGVDDGVPAGLDKNRNKRIGALGNAIVPQVAYQIFASIVEYEKMQKNL